MIDLSQPSYISFRDIFSERTSSIVAWTGAGLSAPAKLPTWPTLKAKLIDALTRKASTLADDDRRAILSTANSASIENNFWVSFQILKRALGDASYTDEIKRNLRPAELSQIPISYKQIWKLGVSGILNLNLDSFATRAHGELYPGRMLNETDGTTASGAMSFLRSQTKFIINLHGKIANPASWVFTHDELTKLLQSDGYLQLISTILSTRTILFVGMSADDISITKHLERLREAGILSGPHFWLTDRNDLQTDSLAESLGIRLIRYTNEHGDHRELKDFFTALQAFMPEDEQAPPVAMQVPASLGNELLPPPDELATQSAEHIRRILNTYATRILGPADASAYSLYENFVQEYDEAIHRAWYLSDKPPRNILFGYELKSEIGRGAFGRVFRATEPSGREVAIKVLHQEVRTKPEMLQGFRRGVRSMQILSQHGIRGMVPYEKASEIPTFAVMELVNGPDLKTAVESGRIDSWSIRLQVAREIAGILHRAHHLPERVLHRDVRPSNIMLRNFWSDPDDWHVVLLDFDLSWHKGALELSVVSPNAVNGYLAPEQTEKRPNESTRSAAVDCFGLGMTLYFICTSSEPIFSQHRHQDWFSNVKHTIERQRCATWKSLPSRIARTIINSTKDKQDERWDLTQIQNELSRLHDILENPNTTNSAELLAEEILSLSEISDSYEWNSDRLSAKVMLISGVQVEIIGNESDHAVELHVVWHRRGEEDWRKVGKWIPDAFSKAESLLRTAGWSVVSGNKDQQSMAFYCKASILFAQKRRTDLATSLAKSIDAIRFE